jgi:hypothetical protein
LTLLPEDPEQGLIDRVGKAKEGDVGLQAEVDLVGRLMAESLEGKGPMAGGIKGDNLGPLQRGHVPGQEMVGCGVLWLLGDEVGEELAEIPQDGGGGGMSLEVGGDEPHKSAAAQDSP